MEYLLETQEVVKQYANHLALDHVSIQVPEGQIFGLLGPNGAGKTTLIRIINRITRPIVVPFCSMVALLYRTIFTRSVICRKNVVCTRK